ncbi:MAG: hypothetical protein JWQ98_3432 [Chlorobi bacterium]|nr:hypothetical protein [Chlorobiota bacterium]
MQTYIAFGLTLQSDITLPDLFPGEGAADVSIVRGLVEERAGDGVEERGYYLLRPDLACYAWPDLGRFRMRDGREITVQPDPGVDVRVLRSLLMGPFMAMLLHQRGMLVLHGSGVEVDGRAIGFLGDSGQGKSTTAAALIAAGHRLISDDLLPVAIDGNRHTAAVAPGPMFLKLWPEAAGALGHDPAALPGILSAKDKRMLRVDGGDGRRLLGLDRIYVLGGERAVPIELMEPQETIIALTRHSYCVQSIMAMGEMASHFHLCAALSRVVPIRRLNRAFPLDRLDEMAAAIITDLREHDIRY